jgi:O-antigen ligase
VTTGKGISYVVPGFVVRADEITLTTREVASPTPTPAPSNVINDVSIAIRYNVEWPRAIRAFLKNPILGTGYSSIDLATDNDYLRMLGETGLLGLTAFGLIFFQIGRVLLKTFSVKDRLTSTEKIFVFGMFGALAGTFVTAFLIDLFEASKFAIIFWLLLGCSVSLIKSKVNDQ